jgi:hypothetical protein
MAIIFKANKVNLFVSSVLFVFWYHSPNFLVTPITFRSDALCSDLPCYQAARLEIYRLRFCGEGKNSVTHLTRRPHNKITLWHFYISTHLKDKKNIETAE